MNSLISEGIRKRITQSLSELLKVMINSYGRMTDVTHISFEIGDKQITIADITKSYCDNTYKLLMHVSLYDDLSIHCLMRKELCFIKHKEILVVNE